MCIIHIGVKDWLVVNDVIRPRFLIHCGPAPTSSRTRTKGYEIEQWSLAREHRVVRGWTGPYADAETMCASLLEPLSMYPTIDHQAE